MSRGRMRPPARRLPQGRALAASTLGVLLVTCGAADAQGSRAEVLAGLQADKASQLRPPERSAGEQALDWVERGIGTAGAVYPWVGSIHPGGLLAFGAGLRQTFADTGAVSGLAGWSLKNFKTARGEVRLPAFADRRVAITAGAGWLDAPEVAFYGIGNDTARTGRAMFGYSPTTVGVGAAARVADRMVATAGVDYLAIGSDTGTTGTAPAPGLGTDLTYVAPRTSLAIDWRDSPGYSRRGGLYRLHWTAFVDRGSTALGFDQTEAEIVQLLPLFRGSSIVALRGLVTTTSPRGRGTPPVFMMPALGGGSTLRGYPSWRFRDRHRLLLSGEYRWTPAQVIDMALFVDAGKVAAERTALGLQGLHRNVGIGIRLHGPTFTALRLDVARGREGWVLNLGAGAPF